MRPQLSSIAQPCVTITSPYIYIYFHLVKNFFFEGGSFLMYMYLLVIIIFRPGLELRRVFSKRHNHKDGFLLPSEQNEGEEGRKIEAKMFIKYSIKVYRFLVLLYTLSILQQGGV